MAATNMIGFSWAASPVGTELEMVRNAIMAWQQSVAPRISTIAGACRAQLVAQALVVPSNDVKGTTQGPKQ